MSGRGRGPADDTDDGGGDEGGRPRARSRARSTTRGEEDLLAELSSLNPEAGGGAGAGSDAGSGTAPGGDGSGTSGAAGAAGAAGVAGAGAGAGAGGSRGGVGDAGAKRVGPTPVSSRTRDILELRDYSPPRGAHSEFAAALGGADADEEMEELRRLEAAEKARRDAEASKASSRSLVTAVGPATGGVRKLLVQKTKGAKPEHDMHLKLLLLGDGGVGKTALLLRYAEDKFTPGLLATAGVAFQTEYIEVDGKKVRLDIWDTAGQQRFHVITQSYYAGAHGIILVYDESDATETSFDNVRYWMDNIKTHASPHCVKVLLGNKSDVKGKKISKERGQAVADEFGMPFFETSAKDGTNVVAAFHAIAKEAVVRQGALAPGGGGGGGGGAGAGAAGGGGTGGGGAGGGVDGGKGGSGDDKDKKEKCVIM